MDLLEKAQNQLMLRTLFETYGRMMEAIESLDKNDPRYKLVRIVADELEEKIKELVIEIEEISK